MIQIKIVRAGKDLPVEFVMDYLTENDILHFIKR